MENVISSTVPDTARLEAAINTADLDAVKVWVAEFGINTKVVYQVPGASFEANIKGTPFAIAVAQGQGHIAFWLLQNGASQEMYSYNTEAGYRQNLVYHPIGPALLHRLDAVVKLMLKQGVDFHTEQRIWHESSEDAESEVLGPVVLNHKATRPVLERIGRLDVLEFLAKQDFRTQEERDYAADCAAA